MNELEVKSVMINISFLSSFLIWLVYQKKKIGVETIFYLKLLANFTHYKEVANNTLKWTFFFSFTVQSNLFATLTLFFFVQFLFY